MNGWTANVFVNEFHVIDSSKFIVSSPLHAVQFLQRKSTLYVRMKKDMIQSPKVPKEAQVFLK